MYGNRLYFGTPDAHMISLDARNGEKLWDVEVAAWKFGYYISVPPLVVWLLLMTAPAVLETETQPNSVTKPLMPTYSVTPVALKRYAELAA